MLNAREASLRTKNAFLTEIFDLIRSAADQGHNDTTVEFHTNQLFSHEIDTLIELGFEVRQWKTVRGDYTFVYVKIRWEKI